METYSCETHIDHALDIFVAQEQVFPTMNLIDEEQPAKTCSYCDEKAIYIVSR